MAKNVAFYGGHSIYTLGPASDAAVFFRCVAHALAGQRSGPHTALITDRLYRRYLRQDELEPASQEMQVIGETFSARRARDVDWHDIGVSVRETILPLKSETLAEVFAAYFLSFEKAKNSAIAFFEAFKRYNPVRIVFADLPDFALDKRRPLEDYDRNDRSPFWLQRMM